MILSVLNTSPNNLADNIAIDSKISITFNQEIDEFTVENGISLYSIDKDKNYIFVPYETSIDGSVLTITPETLLPDTKHYISVLPGSDISRYLSAQTVSSPEYNRILNSTGEFTPMSSYTGENNVTYSFAIEAENNVGITRGLSFVDTIAYIPNEPIILSDLTFSLDGSFDSGDEIQVSCFKSQGVDSIYKVEFSTSKYTTISPGSEEILDIDQLNELYIVDTIPENLSVDNMTCNPIVIKFNKQLAQEQDIKSKIQIKKSDVLGNRKRIVDYEYIITGNIVKLYLKSIGNPIP